MRQDFKAGRAAALVGAALGLAAVAMPASATCYYVYGANNALLYRSTLSPVDLSRPISEAMRGRFGGAHLTMVPDDADCPELASYGPNEPVVRRPATVLPTDANNTSPIEASPLFRNIESRSAFRDDGGISSASPTNPAARRGR